MANLILLSFCCYSSENLLLYYGSSASYAVPDFVIMFVLTAKKLSAYRSSRLVFLEFVVFSLSFEILFVYHLFLVGHHYPRLMLISFAAIAAYIVQSIVYRGSIR
jgi:hypothetical protein